MKKSSLIVVLVICLLMVAGCESKDVIKSDSGKVNVSTMQHKHCTRAGTASGIETDLSYDVYYTGDILNVLKSVEKVISDDEEKLTTYEDAYKGIFKNYEGLKYYDATVSRDDNSVTSTIVINYDKIDIDRLLELEGEDDNIIEDGKAKVDKWLEFAKKFGTKCEEVVDKEESSGV